MPLALTITVIAAIFIITFGNKSYIKGDAIVALISVSSLGLGYLFLNLFGKSTNLSGDVCTTLFGSTSILTLKFNQVILSVILSIIVIILFFLFYNKIFCITFDEDFAKSSGVNVSFYNIMIAIIIAVIIVLSMNLVGSLLVSALIIFPALSSMRLFKSFKSVVICSVLISIVASTIGLLIAILIGTPVGSTIVLADLLIFVVFNIIGKNKKFV